MVNQAGACSVGRSGLVEMKSPKHSKAAEKAHPAPVRAEFKTAKAYTEACRLVNEARIAFDAPKPSHPLMLDGKDWNRALVMDHICNQLATTSRGIGNILTAGYDGKDLPSYSSIMSWIGADTVLLEKYTRAKEAQADFMADEILDIADDGTNDWMERHDKEGENVGYQINGEHVQRSRLRIESRKWLASKLKPKKYGDKLAVGGADDLPPVQITKIERVIVANKA